MKDPIKLVGYYRRCLATPDGEQVMEDLREFCMMDAQASADLTHAECAYRNGMQDFYRYIESLVAD